MSLKARISDDMKAALRARDAARLSAIRLLLAAIQQREVDERKELGDPEVLAVVEKLIKQRKESVVQFEKAARAELAAAEKFEIGVLQGYLPSQLGETEIAAAVEGAIAEAGASGIKDMGRVMALLKPKLAGRAEMAKVSALVKAKLGG